MARIPRSLCAWGRAVGLIASSLHAYDSQQCDCSRQQAKYRHRRAGQASCQQQEGTSGHEDPQLDQQELRVRQAALKGLTSRSRIRGSHRRWRIRTHTRSY
jgi:hypothetical protein